MTITNEAITARKARTARYAALRAQNVPVEVKRSNAREAIDASYKAFENGRAFFMEDGDGYVYATRLTDDNEIVTDCLAPDGSSNGISSCTDFENWELFCAQGVHLGYAPADDSSDAAGLPVAFVIASACGELSIHGATN